MADIDDACARAITSGVVGDRRLATTGSAGSCRLSRYPTKAPSAAYGHGHTRTHLSAGRSGPLTAAQRQE
jgi:hypothetical protein